MQLAFASLLLLLASCTEHVCEIADESRIAELPSTLSATGLFADITTGALADGVLAYRPRFELWTDGAEKSRSNPLGILSMVGLGARVDITSRLHVAGGAHAGIELVRPLEWIERGSRVQPSAHAELDRRINGAFSLGVRCIVPVSGPLGGNTLSAGLSIAHTR